MASSFLVVTGLAVASLRFDSPAETGAPPLAVYYSRQAGHLCAVAGVVRAAWRDSDRLFGCYSLSFHFSAAQLSIEVDEEVLGLERQAVFGEGGVRLEWYTVE